MALAGLASGVATADDHVWCPGWYTLGNSAHRFRCWQRHGHGRMDMLRAISQSCDVYFYDLAMKLGIDRMHAQLGRFGLGARTGIDLPGEQAGLLPSQAWKRRARKAPWYPGETLIAGIGQGYNTATPLQLAYATALIASRGRTPSPAGTGAPGGAGDGTGPAVPGQRRTVADHCRCHACRGGAGRYGLSRTRRCTVQRGRQDRHRAGVRHEPARRRPRSQRGPAPARSRPVHRLRAAGSSTHCAVGDRRARRLGQRHRRSGGPPGARRLAARTGGS